MSIAGRRSSCMRNSGSAGWKRASAAKVRTRRRGQRPWATQQGDWQRKDEGLGCGLGARVFYSGCAGPCPSQGFGPKRLSGRAFGYHLEKKVGLEAMEISVSLDSFQAACCCTNRTSLRSWDCAVSLVLTAPRPASVESLSSWTAAPGTSAVRTVRASTCCGTAR